MQNNGCGTRRAEKSVNVHLNYFKSSLLSLTPCWASSALFLASINNGKVLANNRPTTTATHPWPGKLKNYGNTFIFFTQRWLGGHCLKTISKSIERNCTEKELCLHIIYIEMRFQASSRIHSYFGSISKILTIKQHFLRSIAFYFYFFFTCVWKCSQTATMWPHKVEPSPEKSLLLWLQKFFRASLCL